MNSLESFYIDLLVRERVFVIGGLIDSITVDEKKLSLEEKKQYSQHIKESIEKLMKILHLLF